jgi:hypothetical protein
MAINRLKTVGVSAAKPSHASIEGMMNSSWDGNNKTRLKRNGARALTGFMWLMMGRTCGGLLLNTQIKWAFFCLNKIGQPLGYPHKYDSAD